VIRRSTHLGGNFPPSYEVEYRNGSSLLIPVAATEAPNSANNQTKLSIDALQELISVVNCLDTDEYRSKKSLDDTAAGSTAPDCRRRRRGLGGGLS
jgi:hypothetical protein